MPEGQAGVAGGTLPCQTQEGGTLGRQTQEGGTLGRQTQEGAPWAAGTRKGCDRTGQDRTARPGRSGNNTKKRGWLE